MCFKLKKESFGCKLATRKPRLLVSLPNIESTRTLINHFPKKKSKNKQRLFHALNPKP
ncbi:hypothetical protein Sjap_023281 [Stephania japonica]|uniref:Uncharacterized protein n=1 Tax=Stephania japonica TaxID=461633 RepID=A0AAP0HKB4_9MAGN